jgi:hypothetical protein
MIDFAPHDLTSNTSHSPFVVSASSIFSSNFDSWKAFQGSWGSLSYWIGTNYGVDWLKLDIGSGNTKKLYSYSIRVNSIPEPTRAPKNWTMEGSNDNLNWDVLDTQTNQTSWTTGESRNFVCATYTTSYRYFRLNITANNGDTYTQVGELYLYYDDIVVSGQATAKRFGGVPYMAINRGVW